MHPMKFIAALIGAFSTILASANAWAAQPTPWQMNFQPAATPIMERVSAFNELVFWIILVITAFVVILLLIIIIRFRASANPVPSKTSHNTVLEVLWTVVPIIIVIGIAIPSFKLLYYIDEVPDSEFTIKVVGHQWYWTYEYPDQEIAFDSLMIPEDELKAGPDPVARGRQPDGRAGRHKCTHSPHRG